MKSVWLSLRDDNAGKAHRALGRRGLPAQAVRAVPSRIASQPVAVAEARSEGPAADCRPGQRQRLPYARPPQRQLERARSCAGADAVRCKVRREANPPLETRRRLEQVLKASWADVPGPETLRTIRAIMARERIASPEAQAVLEALAGGARDARDRGSQGVIATPRPTNRQYAVTMPFFAKHPNTAGSVRSHPLDIVTGNG